MALRRREPSGRWRYDEEQGRKETSVARRRARSKEVGCKGKEARYDEKQGDGDVSGKEEGSGGRHEVVERGGAQPCGWLKCFLCSFCSSWGP